MSNNETIFGEHFYKNVISKKRNLPTPHLEIGDRVKVKETKEQGTVNKVFYIDHFDSKTGKDIGVILRVNITFDNKEINPNLSCYNADKLIVLKNLKKEHYSAVAFDGTKQINHLTTYSWDDELEDFIKENEDNGFSVLVDFYPENSKGKPERTAYKSKM